MTRLQDEHVVTFSLLSPETLPLQRNCSNGLSYKKFYRFHKV